MRTSTKMIVAAAVLIGAFLLGFIPQYRRAAALDSQLTAAQARLRGLESDAKLARVRDLAGALFLETVNHNYGLASGRASEFFNQVRAVESDPAASAHRQTLRSILDQHDSVIANLAKPDPASQKEVEQILQRALKMESSLKPQ